MGAILMQAWSSFSFRGHIATRLIGKSQISLADVRRHCAMFTLEKMVVATLEVLVVG
jgi:hypothetical protein